MVSVSSRLDLAVRCHSNADIYFHQGGNRTEKAHMVHIHVLDESSRNDNGVYSGNSMLLEGPTVALPPALPSSPYWDMEQETTWKPRRPYYMPDLASPERRIEETWVLSMDDYFNNGTKGVSVNQVTWDPDKAIRNFDLALSHSYFAFATVGSHINRMLVVEPGGCGFGRFEEGQYYDTVTADQDECKVRVKFFDFAGRIVIHCHRFGHEDKGMMSWIDVLGGHGHGLQATPQVDCSAVL
ncbi:MAG: hypothetical protein SGARI_003661 [Bacillariaceae sp.]